MTTATITLIRPRRWLHAATGLFIWLPCDKRSFRVGNRDGDEQTPRRFRSLRTAAAFLDRLANAAQR
jgi:hypothetical protein